MSFSSFQRQPYKEAQQKEVRMDVEQPIQVFANGVYLQALALKQQSLQMSCSVALSLTKDRSPRDEPAGLS